MLYDIVAICFSGGVTLLLRYDFSYNSIAVRYLDSFWNYIPINLIVTITVFFMFKMYNSLWEFAGVIEIQNIISGCIIASMLQLVGLHIMKLPMPRSYYFIYGIVLCMLICVSRFLYRFLRMRMRKRYILNHGTNTMVIGAGEAGNMIIKEIVMSEHLLTNVKCIIDDDPDKLGSYIHGIKVVGDRYTISEYVEYYGIDDIIIAMPSASGKLVKDIIAICQKTKCNLKILPGMYQLMNGEVNVSKLRNVDVEDLLGRDPVDVDMTSIMEYIENKVVLVTGGGGSIGSELCRQIAGYSPHMLVILDIYENNAYEIQQELKVKYPKLNLVVLIASVRNTKRMEYIFEKYRPDIVYHTAAHKHVPLMEDSPNEAIKNNVFGTWKTVQASIKYNVKKFVLISTDKAVNPTNIMGASKRICEMIVQSYNKSSKTDFVAVRFGNVLGSNGSVIPLFKKQIEMGGPVTVTHPDIIRYFMTIPEAVSLVLQAGVYAKGGEVFVLNMGEPVKILTLAENLIRLSGYVPYEDIAIEFTGLRPGEKLYEELLMDEEGMKETDNKMIHIGRSIDFNEEEFFGKLENLKNIVENENNDIRKFIGEIVPTYTFNGKL